MAALAAIAFTLLVYFLLWRVQRYFNWLWFNPMLISLFIIVPLLLVSGTSFSTYNSGAKWLSALLEPAVVALGFPLYQQLNQLKRDWRAIAAILVLAVIVSLLSSITLSLLLAQQPALMKSLALKHITTPIALELSQLLGGINSITAIVIILAGLLGALIGPAWLKFIGIHDSASQGLAIGAASHVLGTATVARDDMTKGAYSALALIVCALFTSIISPILFSLLL